MWYRTARICIERQCSALDGGEVFTLNKENMSLRSNATGPAGDIVQYSLNEDATEIADMQTMVPKLAGSARLLRAR
jgi:hypothetical protein